ncbi:peptidoglycan-associated (lipo)protein-likeprotein [Leptotrichia shahii]|uniref:Peptidoglycan-associated (Lipo)protein-likeprotein n=1 Tax=Leptotrichia shahii TaxID=157691 RepID=A0A510JNQ5_9FUSO|nr:OmpA family protein [Leptotrichia shahii]BBM40979.1 peptidoglycan-associated (lipo)protein-likeprotein [Leptotrichia shahii]
MKKMILFFTLVLTINLFSNTSYDEFSQKVEILEEKIKNGDKKAINNLGNLYAKNENSRNIPKAKEYYRLAIKNGSEIASKNLEIANKLPKLCPERAICENWTTIRFVEEDGKIEKMVIRGFPVDKEEVTETEKQEIREEIEYLLNIFFENEEFEIVGYTDETEKNKKKLSLSRAEKMAEFLKQNGLRKDIKITKMIGKGSEDPIDTNDTVEGRYNNRRVEILLKNGKVKKIDISNLLNQLKDE